MSNILITGANRGIGLALSQHYHNLDHNITAVCRQTSDQLNGLDIDIIEGIDVSKSPDIDRLKSKLNDTKFDVLLLNAGILANDHLGHIDYDMVRQQFEVNTIAPLRMTETLLPLINSNGKIAIITSRMGSITDNDSGGSYGYRLSKAAVNMVGKSLAVDLKPKNIAVGLFHPGWVKTDMTSQQGLISAKESAEGLIKQIAKLNIENTGGFWHSNGEQLEW